jgi:hypothetical protein
MDTRQQSSEAAQATPSADQEAMRVYVDAQLDTIKAHMPMTYKAIKDKAGEIGSKAYSLVRLGVAGKPNTFYAIEAGRAVGTPFVNVVGADQLADYIRQFGCTFLILWAAEAQQGGANGTH